MSDIVMLYFLQNVFTFGLIFWLLTWVTEYFYKKKQHLTKKQFFECGFKSMSELTVQINLNFALVCVFLILYDVEFTLLFPVLFNVMNITWFEYLITNFFFLAIFMSLLYDWQYNALNWSI